MAFLGVSLDAASNAAPAFDANGMASLHGADARIACFVVRAREEWMIARETRCLLGAAPGTR